MPRRHGRHAGRAAALVALCLATASCENGTGPDTTTCALPASTVDAAALGGVTDAGMHAAALDAADRLVRSVSSGAAGTDLQSSVSGLDQGLAAGDRALACRAATRALRTLSALPDDAGTRPDRAVLALTIEVLTAGMRAE